jgi:hypothetical protein
MTLRVIKPAWKDNDLVAVAAMITASNVTETVLPWNAGTAYAVGDRARVDATHCIYEAQQANTNKPPLDNLTGNAPIWIKVQAANRFAMLDAVNNTQTSNAETIDLTLSPGPFNSLYLGGLSASAVDVIVTVGAAEIYNETFQLIRPVYSWSQWDSEPILRDTDLTLFDIPRRAGAKLRVVIHQPGGTARCGTLVTGLARELGDVQWGAGFRVKSNSSFNADAFGNVPLVKRPAARRVNATVYTPNALFDEVNRSMMEYDGMNLLWSFSSEFKSLNCFGFFEDFDNTISTPAGSFYNLQVLGLI